MLLLIRDVVFKKVRFAFLVVLAHVLKQFSINTFRCGTKSKKGVIPEGQRFRYRVPCREAHHGLCTHADALEWDICSQTRRCLLDLVLTRQGSWISVLTKHGDDVTRTMFYFVALTRPFGKLAVLAQCDATYDGESDYLELSRRSGVEEARFVTECSTLCHT